MIKEHYYDKLLRIKTKVYEKGSPDSHHYYPYEPTDYHVLETLLDSYPVSEGDAIVDFGSGKGRLCFFMHYYKKATVKGVEMNDTFHQAALKNKSTYVKQTKQIHFYCCLAEEYEIQPADNRFYFFNPFSVEIFMTVINHILLSVEKRKRDIALILYYPSEDYIFYLENNTPFQLKLEVPVQGMYERDTDERILIYQL